MSGIFAYYSEAMQPVKIAVGLLLPIQEDFGLNRMDRLVGQSVRIVSCFFVVVFFPIGLHIYAQILTFSFILRWKLDND